MVENTLEELILRRMSLGFDFDPEDLLKGAASKKSPIEKTISFFLSNDTFKAAYKNSHPEGCSLEEDINFMMPLAMLYAYYFALDYKTRKSDITQKFNMEYFVSSISEEKMKEYFTIDPHKGVDNTVVQETITEISVVAYDALRKRKTQFLRSISKMKDPLHYNPFFRQSEKDYFGNIPKYFVKILGSEKKAGVEIFEEDLNIKDFLPAITLTALEISALLPTSSKTESGAFSFSLLEKMDEAINQHNSVAAAVPLNKYSDLLYKLVSEDLFFMDRFNNTLLMYLLCLEENKNKKYKDEWERRIAKSIFAPFLFMPSFGIQERYKKGIKEAADMLINKITGAKEILLKDIFCKQQPAIFASNILFPQLLIVLIGFLFSDRKGEIIQEKNFGNVILFLEKYINEHLEDVEKHFDTKAVHLWNDSEINSVIETIQRNKGLANGKTRYETQKRISPEYTKLGIKNISRYIIESEDRWKYTTIVERNLGMRKVFKQFGRDWHNDAMLRVLHSEQNKRWPLYETFEIYDAITFLEIASRQFASIVVYDEEIKAWEEESTDNMTKIIIRRRTF